MRVPELRLRDPLVVLVALVAGACGDSPTGSEPVVPEIVAIVAPDVGATVARDLRVELDAPGSVLVTYRADGAPELVLTSPESGSSHTFDLLRLRSDREYTVRVVPLATNNVGGEEGSLTFTTDTLPTHLAALDFTTSGSATAPLQLLEITVPQLAGSPIVVDAQGEIVWFREDSEELTHGVAWMDGHGFAVSTQDGISIVDAAGRVTARLEESDAAAREGLGSFEIHHDIMTSTLERVLFLVEDTATVQGEVWTGEAIWSWDFVADRLEKHWSTHDVWTPADHSGDRSWTGDWLHANSLARGPRGNIVVSLFWTHEVVSVAADFSGVEWSLGGPASTFDVADGAMDAGQHTAVEIAEDRVLLFDNGLDRPDSTRYSRAIELQLDRTAGTAEVVWEYRPTPDIFAPIVSSARRLANGNTVVAFGTAQDFGGLPSSGPITVHEVTPAAEVAWTLEIGGASLLYRATPLDRIGFESLLPR